MTRPAAFLAAPLLALAALASPATAQGSTTFQAPSGNIHCASWGDGVVDCEIVEMDGRPLLAQPADCDLDWGHRFAVGGSGPASMLCYGDTVRDPGSAVLPYGSSTRIGAVTCTSRESGLECVNADGHGFALARAGQRLF